MRLIDADALLKEIDGIHQRHYANSSYQFIHDFFLAMFRRIKKAPTIDAVEVVHGLWAWDGKHFYCSNCAGTRFHDLALGLDSAFCPYCGAKMDGGNYGEL